MKFIFLSVLMVVSTLLMGQNTSSMDAEIGIHYPIATSKEKDCYSPPLGNDIFNTIASNTQLSTSLQNALQIQDPLSITDADHLKVTNAPGAVAKLGYTFSKHVGVNLSAYFSTGKMTGQNSFIYTPQMHTGNDTAEIGFERKLFSAGLQAGVSYFFGKKKIHPYLGGGFIWMHRTYQAYQHTVQGVSFQSGSDEKFNGVGISAQTGVCFELEHNINLDLSAYYQGINYKNCGFLSVPGIQLCLDISLPLGKQATDTTPLTFVEPDYPHNEDTVILWDPGPLLDVPPPGDECLPPDDIDIKEKINDLIDLLNKLKELSEKTEAELNDNDLYNEVQALKSIAELLDLFSHADKLDSTLINALSQFMQCNSQPLRDLVSKNKDFANTVILPLKVLKLIIAAKMMDPKVPKAEKAKLKSTYKYLKEKIEKLEKAVENGESADKILQEFDKIKSEINWPADLLKTLLEDALNELSKYAESKAKDALKKELQALLTKILGNASAAKAAISIGKDIIDLVDVWNKIKSLEESDRQWNEGLLKIIELAKKGNMVADSVSCVWWNIESDDVDKIVITAHMKCWCPKPGGKPGEGEWKNTQLDLDTHDQGNNKKLTKSSPGNNGQINVKPKIPPKAQRPCGGDNCIVFIDVEIYNKKGKIISGGSIPGGVPGN